MIRSLGSLVKGGLHITESYGQVCEKNPLLPIRKYFIEQKKRLSQGITITDIFSHVKHLPSHVVPLVRAGESSGTLGDSLIRSADIVDRDMEYSLKKLTALIEPLMMIGMGIVVGSIALSIMVPIYDVSKNLQH